MLTKGDFIRHVPGEAPRAMAHATKKDIGHITDFAFADDARDSDARPLYAPECNESDPGMVGLRFCNLHRKPRRRETNAALADDLAGLVHEAVTHRQVTPVEPAA